MPSKAVQPFRSCLLKRAIIYARRNRWLTSLGRAALHAPVIGPTLGRVQQCTLPRGQRVWLHIDNALAKGLWLQADPYHEQEYLGGNAEPDVQQTLATFLKPGGCFFDVGAHVGFYSLIASRLVGASGRVVSFEPDPWNAQLLREHADQNGIVNISVMEAAVWHADGQVPFLRGEWELSGRSSRRGAVVESQSSARPGETILVRSVTLDSVVAAAGCSPSLIKIDVEGAECEVLKGAGRLLAEAKPTLVCEVHQEQAARFLAEFLPANRYTLRWMPLRYAFPFPRHLMGFPLAARQ